MYQGGSMFFSLFTCMYRIKKPYEIKTHNVSPAADMKDVVLLPALWPQDPTPISTSWIIFPASQRVHFSNLGLPKDSGTIRVDFTLTGQTQASVQSVPKTALGAEVEVYLIESQSHDGISCLTYLISGFLSQSAFLLNPSLRC